MNDYIRRTGKFIIYLAAIFALVLVLFPMISGGKAPSLSLSDFIHNQRFTLFFGLVLAYAFVYPLIAFVKIKRHLNGTFTDNRVVFEKAFETLQYIKTEETTDKIIYRRKSKFARFAQWYEDSIVIDTAENPVIISGMRKAVTRIDRIIDHLLIKASE
jgi:hypothetical protein